MIFSLGFMLHVAYGYIFKKIATVLCKLNVIWGSLYQFDTSLTIFIADRIKKGFQRDLQKVTNLFIHCRI
jgi:hypothetical protein